MPSRRRRCRSTGPCRPWTRPQTLPGDGPVPGWSPAEVEAVDLPEAPAGDAPGAPISFDDASEQALAVLSERAAAAAPPAPRPEVPDPAEIAESKTDTEPVAAPSLPAEEVSDSAGPTETFRVEGTSSEAPGDVDEGSLKAIAASWDHPVLPPGRARGAR